MIRVFLHPKLFHFELLIMFKYRLILITHSLLTLVRPTHVIIGRTRVTNPCTIRLYLIMINSTKLNSLGWRKNETLVGFTLYLRKKKHLYLTRQAS